MNQVSEILKEYQLKNTKLRYAVLEIFMESKTSLSHNDLSNKLNIDFDRVTLFRTLTTFEEVGILHRIIDFEGTAQYAFTTENEKDDEQCHAHFVCLSCKEIFCMDEAFPLSKINAPKDFQKISLDIKVSGYCANCLRNPHSNQLNKTKHS